MPMKVVESVQCLGYPDSVRVSYGKNVKNVIMNRKDVLDRDKCG